MKIIPNQNFKHETMEYIQGQSYEVDLPLAEYFAAAGWLQEGELTKRWEEEERSLEIHDGTIGHSSEVN